MSEPAVPAGAITVGDSATIGDNGSTLPPIVPEITTTTTAKAPCRDCQSVAFLRAAVIILAVVVGILGVYLALQRRQHGHERDNGNNTDN